MQISTTQSISKFTDSELLLKLKHLASEERKLTLEILHFLKEVESRKLYAKRAYSNLHEFCVRELGYSSGAAYRRIESMRLLREVPQAESKILTGEPNLSVLSKVQSYVKHEKKYLNKTVTLSEKKELLNTILRKSTREVDQELYKRAPSMAPKFQESIKVLSENKTALQIVADQELMELLERAKSISGTPGEDLGALLKRALRTYVGKKMGKEEVRKEGTLKGAKTRNELFLASAPGPKKRIISSSSKLIRYIPRHIQREVRRDAHHKCEWKDKHTSKRCKETNHLQIDHIHPFAQGGSNERENLRLICSAHNKLKAERDFGRMAFHKKFATQRSSD